MRAELHLIQSLEDLTLADRARVDWPKTLAGRCEGPCANHIEEMFDDTHKR